jgi:hypothetical protein
MMALITDADSERFERELAYRLLGHENRINEYPLDTVSSDIWSVLLVVFVVFVIGYPIVMGILRRPL